MTPPLKSKSEEDASVSQSSVPSKYSDASPGKRPCVWVSVAPPATVIVFPLTSGNSGAMLLSAHTRTTGSIAIRSHGLVFGDGRWRWSVAG